MMCDHCCGAGYTVSHLTGTVDECEKCAGEGQVCEWCGAPESECLCEEDSE